MMLDTALTFNYVGVFLCFSLYVIYPLQQRAEKGQIFNTEGNSEKQDIKKKSPKAL